MRQLIVTADDFGLSAAVNEAVEDAHRRGILSAASLMVAGDAAEDAVARARQSPGLGVGLHLVLIDGRPILPPARLGTLVDGTGRFPDNVFGLGTRLYFDARARDQAEAEMRAQFEAFRATGLPLDHVNAHHHFHFHPVVRDLLLKLALEFGVKAIRVPREPAWLTWRVAGDRIGARVGNKLMLGWFTAQLARHIDRIGLGRNHWQLGLSDTGAMDKARLARLLAALPEGITEIYAHPSAGNAEYQALIDPEIVATVKRLGVTPIRFAALR